MIVWIDIVYYLFLAFRQQKNHVRPTMPEAHIHTPLQRGREKRLFQGFFSVIELFIKAGGKEI